jgi:predicted ATPase
MQKIIIKNFGPVKNAEIEIKKVLILIGEQASGKSTIAKLIYFFKTLKEDILIKVFESSSLNDFDIKNDLAKLIKQKFIIFWGLSQIDYEIVFYYSVEDNKYVKVSANENNHLDIQLSKDFLDADLIVSFNHDKSALQDLRENQQFLDTVSILKNNNVDSVQTVNLDPILKPKQGIDNSLNHIFKNEQERFLFVIAGRNVTVGYFDLFEKYLLADRQNRIHISNKDSFEMKGDDPLIFDFLRRVSSMKSFSRRFGSFSQFIENYVEKEEDKEQLKKVVVKTDQMLRGKYRIDNDGEKIILNNNEKIYLQNASSGQQEVIRILQDIFMVFIEKAKVLRVIEEPEAHLFPIAQKQLVELLALMVNYQSENQLIITTHSPYILSVFSNLLFASRVVEKNPAAEAEVQEIIDKDCWLNPQEFSAYSLGNQSFPEEMQYCEPIFDNKMGNIKQNYLDTVSEILGAEFSQLYSIHGKTFKRR